MGPNSVFDVRYTSTGKTNKQKEQKIFFFHRAYIAVGMTAEKLNKHIGCY